MPGKPPLPPEEDIERATSLLKALGHPTRFKVAWFLLYHGEQSVSALVEQLAAPQPIVSQQLGILRMAGIVKVRPVHGSRLYSIAMPELRDVFECMEKCCSRGSRWS